MKKYILITLILCSQIFSQTWDRGVEEEEKKEPNWHVYGGLLSMSGSYEANHWWDDTERHDLGSMNSFNVGIMRSLSERLNIGIGYTQRGGETSSYSSLEYTGFELWTTVNLFSVGSGVVWVGPSYMIPTSVEIVYDEGDYDEEDYDDGGETYDLTEDYDFDNNLSLTLGLSFPVGEAGMALHLAYQTSLSPVEEVLKEDSDYITEYDFDQIMINLSIPLNLKN